MSKPILYSYYLSSASWRVRTALNLKKIPYDLRVVNLKNQQQRNEAYLAVNPVGQVPSLQVGQRILTQSVAIIEYLEENYDDCRLFPGKSSDRAHIRSVVELINSGIQPLQTLDVTVSINGWVKQEVTKNFIKERFAALETLIQPFCGRYSFGDSVTVGDLFIVPQVFNAKTRFNVDLNNYKLLSEIYENLMLLEPFQLAHPYSQPDCPEELKSKSFSLIG